LVKNQIKTRFGREEELKSYILSISRNSDRFKYIPKDYTIKIEKEKQVIIAKTMLKLDKNLSNLRDEIVPK
jgi:hypothetical protein